ncbi:MAG TPA: DUF3786 domain-containing protein [bacterium]|nr:DUF3786 domain-containing protein [bacterium]HNT65864.1 DUF3786 domain-containing protein [bacterium]HOX86656.1 DUF3786 domain-containing protein [bacterium]HPG46153.1 DUF3786 domain-containing protein [bacterium]HPM98218.1 DUF3786 domain-containing protein [bacterium]
MEHHLNQQNGQAKALQLAIERLRSRDLDAACRRLGLPAPQNERSSVRFLGKNLLLTLPELELLDLSLEQPARPVDRLLLLHLLLSEVNWRQNDDWISFRDLPGGLFYWQPFRNRSLLPLVSAIGNDLQRLRDRLDCFDWQPLAIGDLGARIQVVGLLQIGLVYRTGDNEFSPTADLLLPAAIRHALPTEDVTVLAGRICHELGKTRAKETL